MSEMTAADIEEIGRRIAARILAAVETRQDIAERLARLEAQVEKLREERRRG